MVRGMLLSAWLFDQKEFPVMMKAAVAMGLLGCEARLLYFMLVRCKIQTLIPTVDATQVDSKEIVERLKVLAALETGSDFKFTVTPNSVPGAIHVARPYRESFSGALDLTPECVGKSANQCA